jgi:hypothetical protein
MKDDGTVSTFSTPGRNLDAMESEFFNRQRYQQLSNSFELGKILLEQPVAAIYP